MLSKCPPQNCAEFVKFCTLSGSCHTHVLRRLDLKLWTPTIEKRSQKKQIKNATLTSKGAAFFKLRRITLKWLVLLVEQTYGTTYRGTAGEIQKTDDTQTTQHSEYKNHTAVVDAPKAEHKGYPVRNHGNKVRAVKRVSKIGAVC